MVDQIALSDTFNMPMFDIEQNALDAAKRHSEILGYTIAYIKLQSFSKNSHKSLYIFDVYGTIL